MEFNWNSPNRLRIKKEWQNLLFKRLLSSSLIQGMASVINRACLDLTPTLYGLLLAWWYGTILSWLCIKRFAITNQCFQWKEKRRWRQKWNCKKYECHHSLVSLSTLDGLFFDIHGACNSVIFSYIYPGYELVTNAYIKQRKVQWKVETLKY